MYVYLAASKLPRPSPLPAPVPQNRIWTKPGQRPKDYPKFSRFRPAKKIQSGHARDLLATCRNLRVPCSGSLCFNRGADVSKKAMRKLHTTTLNPQDSLKNWFLSQDDGLNPFIFSSLRVHHPVFNDCRIFTRKKRAPSPAGLVSRLLSAGVRWCGSWAATGGPGPRRASAWWARGSWAPTSSTRRGDEAERGRARPREAERGREVGGSPPGSSLI